MMLCVYVCVCGGGLTEDLWVMIPWSGPRQGSKPLHAQHTE